MDIKNIKDYLTIAQAAQYMGVHVGTVKSWGNKSMIKEYRNPINKYRYYLKSDLDSFLKGISEASSRE